MDEDISRLKATAVGLLNDLGCNGSTLTEDLINEMCRYGAAELHAVSAFIGGIASQEIIKVCLFLIELCITSSYEDLIIMSALSLLPLFTFHIYYVLQLITRQFIPMSGTFIFNGIDHKSQLLML